MIKDSSFVCLACGLHVIGQGRHCCKNCDDDHKRRTETLVRQIATAINANNGQCAVIEEALTKALDFVLENLNDE